MRWPLDRPCTSQWSIPCRSLYQTRPRKSLDCMPCTRSSPCSVQMSRSGRTHTGPLAWPLAIRSPCHSDTADTPWSGSRPGTVLTSTAGTPPGLRWADTSPAGTACTWSGLDSPGTCQRDRPGTGSCPSPADNSLPSTGCRSGCQADSGTVLANMACTRSPLEPTGRCLPCTRCMRSAPCCPGTIPQDTRDS